MSCILCERRSPTAFYNFGTSATVHSETPIKSFCQKIIGSSLADFDVTELICECCYDSLNELDRMEKRTKEITEDLRKRYFNKHNNEQQESSEEKEVYAIIALKSDQEEDESEDAGASDFRSNSPEVREQDYKKVNNIGKIHFSNESDLKNILQNQLNIKEDSNNSDDIKEEHDVDVSVLYDMMDEKNIEILVEPKKDNSHKKIPQCSKCSETFKTSQELRAHAASHNEERPYICEVCGKVYRHKSALDIHVGMHNGIYPFKCLYCNKSFTQKGALIRHVKIHTGEKPFQCEQCGKCFTHHTSFNIHKISHSGEKSYKCEICGLRLISTSHLKRHMRVHTGEKKYCCQICGKKFAERYNLVSHEKLHGTGTIAIRKKKFKCNICGTAYPKRHALEDHVLKDHSSTDDNNYMLVS